ncbi:hypothetical protein AXF42_Ash018903 [Apostasia shenzhenica]|uniref:Lipocalin/cytosolic fatty-acid binding domain-containing protein n=1 Tax=Apostasia shenzhenica TaxID=1088818 RepID=A0A2I0B538_9ASPA|nr:hypothetical protein AXF42_Ash018903 [Apostasia shenzhenica]
MAATIGFSCPLLPFSGFALAPSDPPNHQRSILSLTPRSAAMAAVASAKSPAKEMSAVSGLDLERYMGRWYEIACFPSAFQPRDGRGTRATYSSTRPGAAAAAPPLKALRSSPETTSERPGSAFGSTCRRSSL